MFAVAELDGSLDLKSKYVYTNGMLVGRIDANDELFQYFHDGLGSITMISDSTGSYQNLYAYDDFGNFRSKTENVSNSYCYTGQERDEEPSGLYNLRARYYAPGIGRFTQEDPINFDWRRTQRMNFYTYVMNNPLNRLDPLGLVCMPITSWFPCETFHHVSSKVIPKSDWILKFSYATSGAETGNPWFTIHCHWLKEYTIQELYERRIERYLACVGRCGNFSLEKQNDIEQSTKTRPQVEWKHTQMDVASMTIEKWVCENMPELHP